MKEFINKIMGHFKNDRDYVKEADALIKQVNENIAKNVAAMGAANTVNVDLDRVDKAIKNVENELSKRNAKEVNSLIELIKSSDKKVSTTKIGPIDKKIAMLDKIAVLDKTLKPLEPVIRDWTEAKNFEVNIISDGIKKGMVGTAEGNLVDALNQLFGDSSEQVTFVVKSKADEIYDYLTQGRKFRDGLSKASREIEDEFNEMAGEIEQAGRTAEGVVQNAEAIANKAASMIRNACTAITTVLNHTGRATTVAYNQYKAISDKLINEYAAAHGKVYNKQRKEVSRKMYSTTKERDVIKEKEKEFDAMYDEE